jgi:hypothetical protein
MHSVVRNTCQKNRRLFSVTINRYILLGVFNISVITAASSTSNCLNTTYTTPADTTEDTAPADTTADLPAAPIHAELTASFDVTRRDIQDPPEILEE